MTPSATNSRIPMMLIFLTILFSSGWSLADDAAATIDQLMIHYQEIEAFNGTVLVASDGEVIFSGGYGLANMEWGIANRTDTKFRIGSITKQFTSMLIMQLVEEGKISLDTTVAEILPYYREDTGSRITIHHLLSNTSGLPSYVRPPSGLDAPRKHDEIELYVGTYCSADLEFEPGSRFGYSNSGYRLLGAIIEQVTGESYEESLNTRILGPVGMRDSGYDHDDLVIERRAAGYYPKWNGGFGNARYVDMSIPYSAGALYSTVEDLLRWDQALYTDSLLGKRWRDLMLTPVLGNYAYGWGVRTLDIGSEGAERTIVSHSGLINGFHTDITRVIGDRYLVVLMNNTGEAPLSEIRSGILDILYGRTPSKPKPPVLRELNKAMATGGTEAALARYNELKEKDFDNYVFGESQLNTLCYWLLEEGKTDDAIMACTLNVMEYPDSANPYDSLGEAYMIAGKTDLAIINYAKSLEIDQGNTNAVRQLMKITGVGE